MKARVLGMTITSLPGEFHDRGRDGSEERICSTDNALTRAAASSIARGMPSRRRQISAMVAALSGASVKSRRAACARSTNSLTPSDCSSTRGSALGSVTTLIDCTANSRSPSNPRPSRLVATSRTPSSAARSASARSATSPNKCSQLSRTRRTCFAASCPRMESMIARSGLSVAPSAAAAVTVTRPASTSGPKSMNHTPSGKVGSMISASRSPSRVFPEPPIPVSVNSRVSPRSRAHSASSRSRPMKRVRWRGRLFGVSLLASAVAGVAPPLIAVAIASAKEAAVGKRSAGSFAKALATSRTMGTGSGADRLAHEAGRRHFCALSFPTEWLTASLAPRGSGVMSGGTAPTRRRRVLSRARTRSARPAPRFCTWDSRHRGSVR